MRRSYLAVALVVSFLATALPSAPAEEAPAAGMLSAKVTDVAIFKDGSGIFSYAGEGTVKDGKLVLAETPSPAFGTLWFYSVEDGVTVESVDARDVYPETDRPISDVYALVRNNPGKRAKIVMKDWTLEGVILPTEGDSNQVFLKTETGVAAIPQGELRYAEIADAKTTITSKAQKRQMTITLRGAGEGQKVRIGYDCLQKGIRWLPSYRIDLEGPTAHLALAASVVNDVCDLSGVRASFVVGQPVFALGNLLAPLAQSNRDMRLDEFYKQESLNLLNLKAVGVSLGTYQADYDEFFPVQEADGPQSVARSNLKRMPLELGMATTGEAAEHLFYYTAENVTAARSTSSNVVIHKSDVPVEHIFVWTVDAPPIYQNPEYARRLREIYNGGFFTSDTVDDKSGAAMRYTEASAPLHCLKMTNKTSDPWAAAPVLIFEGERALGQIWFPYTPVAEEAQLVIGPAVDIATSSAEREVRRVIGESKKTAIGKADLVTIEGSLQIENRRKTKATLEVVRKVTGTLLSADNNAEVTARRDQGDAANPTALLKWSVAVEPGQKKALSYKYTKNVAH